MFAGFPLSKPGSGLLMEGAMQQAAQPGRQFIAVSAPAGLPRCR